MSAPAPVLAAVRYRVVKIRLADPAAAAAYLSLVFGVLLVCLPVSFPHMIVKNWENGRLVPGMIFLAALLNGVIYLRAAHLRSAKPGLLTSAWLGALTVGIVVGFSFLLDAAILHEQSKLIPNSQALVNEEIVAHTYWGLISGIFLPYLVIRFTQNLNFRAQAD